MDADAQRKDRIRRPTVARGQQAVRIEHSGSKDWSLAQQHHWRSSGQIYELSGWVRVQGGGNTTLCVTLRDAGDKVTDWALPAKRRRPPTAGDCCGRRFIVPPDTKTMQPRLIGNGPATVWFDDARLVLQGSIEQMRRKDLPATLAACRKVSGSPSTRPTARWRSKIAARAGAGRSGPAARSSCWTPRPRPTASS